MIGKPVKAMTTAAMELATSISDEYQSDKLAYEKYKCGCCGVEVEASKYSEVMKVNKLCSDCLENSKLGIAGKLNMEIKQFQAHNTFDSLKKEKPSKRKIDSKTKMKRAEQSRNCNSHRR